jgi:hypothetical protein
MTHDVETRGLPFERTTIQSGTARTVAATPPRGEAFSGLPSFREILVIMAVSLGVTALLVCGLLSFVYERFYQTLGVNPADVGLTFGVAVSRSVGFIVVLTVAVTLVAVVTRPILAGPRRRLRAHAGWAGTFHSTDFALVLGCYVALGLLAILAAASVISPVTSYTAKAANAARSGNAVRPLQLYGLPLLAMQAEPAIVQPTSKARTLPGIWDLNDRSVLYLGQAGGVGVLYDAVRGRVVYTPMDLVVLHVKNCAGPAPPPDCVDFTQTSR